MKVKFSQALSKHYIAKQIMQYLQGTNTLEILSAFPDDNIDTQAQICSSVSKRRNQYEKGIKKTDALMTDQIL